MLFPNDEKLKYNTNDEYKRLIVTIKDNSERFRFKLQNDYSKQFSHIYAARLGQMRQLLTEKVKLKWGKKIKTLFLI